MQKSLWLFCLSAVGSVYANELVRTAEQQEVKVDAVIDSRTHQEEVLKQAKMESESTATHKYSEQELRDNPAILENLFVEALVRADNLRLPAYRQLYQAVENADLSLIEWADAILSRDQDLNQSVRLYRQLSTNFPDNPYIRFQLAETLFYNQEYEAAKSQFEKLRAANQNEQDIAVFDRFLDVINSKEHWNFAFGASFLNDKNLANSAKEGTQATLPNGATIVYNTPRQSGTGISSWFSADKQWNIQNGKYVKFNGSLANKYYWDNKNYNDINVNLGLGLGYSDARFSFELVPNLQKRWYAGGSSGALAGTSLKQYTDTYGVDLSSGYWLNQKFKYNVYYGYGYEVYRNQRYSEIYNGAMHNVSQSLMYMPNTKQYWALSLDFNHKNAKDKTNAYNRYGSRLTWGQELPLGFSSSTTFGFAKRYYKEASFFGDKQKNKEYSASVSLWHKAFHFAGFTPRVSYTYTKTDSNIPIYRYDKHQVLFNVGKSF